MKNGDFIRNLSDEELVQEFEHIAEGLCDHIPADVSEEYCTPCCSGEVREESREDRCKKCVLKWLKTERPNKSDQ